ncbi:ATP-binding protein, partial [Escherichia coli]|nr:ATP-binding protein [Escherichia coli]
MYKQATELMLNFKDRILIKGEEDTGKSTLLTEIRISDSDSRYYNFKTLNSAGYNRLCDENIDNFDFLNTPEKTLILDGVRLCEKKMTSKVIRLIKQARKYHKRLVVVAD